MTVDLMIKRFLTTLRIKKHSRFENRSLESNRIDYYQNDYDSN